MFVKLSVKKNLLANSMVSESDELIPDNFRVKVSIN